MQLSLQAELLSLLRALAFGAPLLRSYREWPRWSAARHPAARGAG